MPRHYADGGQRALFVLGLTKEAGDDVWETAAPATAAGVGAILPFLGDIGQPAIKHDPILNPNIPRVKSYAELERKLKPGDILLTTKPKQLDPYKLPQVFNTGSEFYHVVPVVSGPTKGEVRVWVDNDALWDYEKDKPRAGGPKPLYKMERRFPEVVALRPKEGLNPKQLKQFETYLADAAKKPYNTTQAITNWLRDVFLPKKTPNIKDLSKVVCQHGICSTVPASARAVSGATPVIAKKIPKHTLPPDFLRSDLFEPVAARVKTRRPSARLVPRWTRRRTSHRRLLRRVKTT
jgi:hypothetical protein